MSQRGMALLLPLSFIFLIDVVVVIATFTINYCYVDITMCHAMKSVKKIDINLF